MITELVVEGYIDAAVVKLVLGSKPTIGSGSGVAKLMREKPQIYRIGIVDKDKKKKFPSYFNEFTQARNNGNGLSWRCHPVTNQHIIIVGEKAIEEWLVDQLEGKDKSLKDFKYDNKRFRSDAKRVVLSQQILAVLGFLYQDPKAPGFVTLKAWIDEIMKEGKNKPKPTSRKRGR